MGTHEEAAKVLTEFQKLCIDLATGSNIDYEDYEEARGRVLSDTALVSNIPEWVVNARFGSQFWGLMKKTSDTYQGRREFIYDSLSPVFDYIEKKGTGPSSISFEEALKNCNSKIVEELWQKIHSRRSNDPKGAITAARSLIECTCKYILDASGIEYSHDADLPTLYKKTAKSLALGPEQHEEEVFKQILGGGSSIVYGMARLRNVFGDAHGKSERVPKPSPRHADLAVNSAGTIATFLIMSYENSKKNS